MRYWYWAVLDGTGLPWALMGCTWLFLAVLGCTGLYWEELDSTGLYFTGQVVQVVNASLDHGQKKILWQKINWKIFESVHLHLHHLTRVTFVAIKIIQRCIVRESTTSLHCTSYNILQTASHFIICFTNAIFLYPSNRFSRFRYLNWTNIHVNQNPIVRFYKEKVL